MFNALMYIRNLEAVGFKREQAEAQVQLVYEALGDEVASKKDLAEFKTEIKAEMAEFKAEVRSDISELRSEISNMKADIIYKLGALMLASTTATTAIIGILIKF